MSPFELDTYNPFSNASQLVNDVHALRRMGERQGITVINKPGAYERTVDPEVIAEARSREAELRRIDREAAEQAKQDRHDERMAMEHRRAGLQRQTNNLLGELVDVADETLMCVNLVALSTLSNGRELGTMVDALATMNGKIDELRATVDRGAETIVSALRKGKEFAADAKYKQAVVNFETKHFDSCLVDLAAVFTENSVHRPAWMLYARVALRLGQPGVARMAFGRVIDYAKHEGDDVMQVSAALRLAKLETAVGNVRDAHQVLVGAMQSTGPWGRETLRFAEIKARFAIPERQTEDEARVIAVEFRRLVDAKPQLRREIEQSTLFEAFREFCPWFKPGPFGETYGHLLLLCERPLLASQTLLPRSSPLRARIPDPDFDLRFSEFVRGAKRLIERAGFVEKGCASGDISGLHEFLPGLGGNRPFRLREVP